MSVTISICDNVQHCTKHKLVRETKEDCLCLCEGKAEADCHYCAGSGEWIAKEYPFEFNVANRNAATLFAALGLEFDYCGQCDARIVLRALKSVDESMVLRDATSGKVEGGAFSGVQFYDGGISPEQASRYLSLLTEIANEAERRESQVCWS